MSRIINYLASQKVIYQALTRTYVKQIQADFGLLNPSFKFMLEHLEPLLLEGGKWHRPAVAELAYRLCGGTDRKRVRLAFLTLELLHRYLLIHDDIIDRDLIRHNQPTLEAVFAKRFSKTFTKKNDVIYSQGMAMVGGDVVNAMAYDWLSRVDLPKETIVLMVQAISRMLMETAAGWQMQTEQNYLPISQVSDADYLTGLRLVSAHYSLIWPLRIGQLLAHSSAWNNYDQHLEDYGLHCGIAFQLGDDVLGMFGDRAKTGKPVGNDYREGKKTLLVLRAYQRADKQTKAWFDATLGNASEKTILRAQALIRSLGALDEVNRQITREIDQAKRALTAVETNDKEALVLLMELAALMQHRSF